MSYILKLTNGTVLTTLQDGTLDTTTSSLTLIGKNYPSYGLVLNDDLVRLMENFSNSTPPNKPLTGQIWYNTSTGNLSYYNGNIFKNATALSVSPSASPPTQNSTGDLWYASDQNILYVYNGLNFVAPVAASAAFTTFKTINVTQSATVGTDLTVGGNIFDNSGYIVAGGYKFSGSTPSGFPTIATDSVLFTNSSGEMATNSDLTFVPGSPGTLTVPNLNVTGSLSLSTATISHLTVGLGSISAPSISNSADAGTGIWFPGSGDSIAASIAGVEVFVIAGSGNTGIGSSSPGEKLDVAGNLLLSAASPTIKFNASGSSIYSAAGELSFGIGSNLSMKLDLLGQVSIGNLAPFSAVLTPDNLTVYPSLTGTTSQLGLRTGTHNFYLINDNAGYLKFNNADTASTIMQMGGPTNSVGIGAAPSTSYALNVGTINATGYYLNGAPFTGGGGGSGTVTGVTATSPVVSSGGTAPVISLASSALAGGLHGGATSVITSFTTDSHGLVTGVTTAGLPTAYTPAPPVLYNVTAGYTGGGRVSVSNTAPTGAIAGDIWFDPSGATGYTQLLSTSATYTPDSTSGTGFGGTGTAGWTKLPNGLIMMWGVTPSTTAEGGTTVTLPNTGTGNGFTTAILSVSATIYFGGTLPSNASTNGNFYAQTYGWTSGLPASTIGFFNNYGGGGSGDTVYISWTAFGH